MKIFNRFVQLFNKKKRRIQDLETKLEEKSKEVYELQEKLKKKGEAIKQLNREIESLRCNKYQFLVARTIDAYVLDASFCGCNNFEEELKNIITSGRKIILTSITIQELKKLTINSSKKTAKHARNILDCALLYSKKFICETIKIDGSPDNSIIKFCSEYKSKVELLTCDKEMALLAEAEDIRVQYFKEQPLKSIDLNAIVDLSKDGYINQFEYPDKFIMVKSHINGDKISSGEYKITPGDEIFIIRDEKYSYEFSHYRIPANPAHCAIIVTDATIWDEEDVICLKRKDYVRFIQYYLSTKTQESF